MCRKTALTQMNAHSSRSHAIVMLTVVKRCRRSSSTSISEDEEIKVGKLFIVVSCQLHFKNSWTKGRPSSKALEKCVWVFALERLKFQLEYLQATVTGPKLCLIVCFN